MVMMKREAPDQRRHIRSNVPMGIRIKGMSYTLKDWSLGGFRLDDFMGGPLDAGTRVLAKFTLAHQGFDVSFTAEVEVVRQSDDERTVAARFVQLNAREKELLGYGMLEATRNGERASLIEALARIDIPVTPVSAVPTAKEAPPPRRGLLNLKRAFWSLFYWTIGLAVGSFAALVLYFHLFRLDLEYSVVTLPLFPVISQDVARCKKLHVQEGDLVKAGDTILEVEDDMLTRDLEVARLQLGSARVDYTTAMGRVEAEEKKLRLYRKISTEKLASMQALVDAVGGQVVAEAAIVKRLRGLVSNRSASQQDLDVATQRLALLEGQLLQARAEAKIAQNSLHALEQGDFYDQRRLVGDLPQFLVNLKDTRERYTLAQERVTQTEARASRLKYRAPFDGKVAKVLKMPDATMNRGEAIMILEKAGGEPVIDAFVTQDDANQLTVGAMASVWLPPLDRVVQAQVVKIDRTSGFLTEMQAHLKDSQLRYNWRGQQDRSAYVQLVLVEDLTPEVRRALTGGTPVTASVPRRPAFWNKLTSLFARE